MTTKLATRRPRSPARRTAIGETPRENDAPRSAADICLASDADLRLIGELSQAVDRSCTLEQAVHLVMRGLCSGNRWIGARAEIDGVRAGEHGAAQVLWYPSSFEIATRQDGCQASYRMRIGTDAEVRVELHSDIPIDADPHAERLIAIIATLLGHVVDRQLSRDDRSKWEAERQQQLELLHGWQEELRDHHARMFTAINNMHHGLAMYDGADKLVICNDLYATMYGLTRADARPGTSLREIAVKRAKKGFDIDDVITDRAFETDGAFSLRRRERTYQLRDGRAIHVSVQALWDGGWVSTHEDVTERQRFQDRIAHLAHHDALTDLANRALFKERLDREMAGIVSGELRGTSLAVLWLDLDRFKPINDTLGHIFGDAVLKAIAQRLQACVSEGDLVARLGGDEFAILHRTDEGRIEVAELACRVREAIKTPLEVEGQCVTVDVSIGICIAPADTKDAATLLRNADIALYRAKADGRCTHRFFEAGMDDKVDARRRLETDLRAALQESRFDLHYQPIVDLVSGAITGCEALLRWQHPTRGAISPVEFIPVAEECGLMVQLGRWVLERACTDAAGWPGTIKVAVNLSASHVMSAQLIADVVRALDRSGLSPDRLEIEITEAVLLQNSDASLQALGALRTMGVRFAMDDFGTGYSSLSYLRRFPFDKIKIDRSFVSDLPDERNGHAIVEAITSMSTSLGLVTTAEGVETAAQRDAVRALGCTQMQGYLFSKPIRNEDLQALIASHRGASEAA